MTVAIFSDSPTVTTGFGRTTARIAAALAARFDVRCFGLKESPAGVAGLERPYRVWPAVRGGPWTDSLARFFDEVQPAVLLLNMDAFNAPECLAECAAAGWSGPTASYVCFDGLPVGRRYLDAQRSCVAVWATSVTGAGYLRSEGIEVAGVAPPGVSAEEFAPSARRAELRAAMGLSSAFLAGIFATNTVRKQLPRALSGFAAAVRLAPDLDLRLYAHCRAQGYWDLDELAIRYGIADRLTIGLPADGPESSGIVLRTAAGKPTSFAALGYAERLGLCDAVVNCPYNGDVEQVVLEAGSCAVPLLHTDDEAIMREAVGDGGVLLPAVDVAVGRCGERQHHVDPAAIGAELVALARDPHRRVDLAQRAAHNASRYPWDVLQAAALDMVEPFVAGTP